jgi:hypothetical protein
MFAVGQFVLVDAQASIGGTTIVLDAPDNGAMGEQGVAVVSTVQNSTRESHDYLARLTLKSKAFYTITGIETSAGTSATSICTGAWPNKLCYVSISGNAPMGASLVVTTSVTLGMTTTENINWAKLEMFEGAPHHTVERAIELHRFVPLAEQQLVGPQCFCIWDRLHNTILESPDVAQTGSTVHMVATFVNYSDRELFFHPHSWVSRQVMPVGFASYELSVPETGNEPQECDSYGCSWWPYFSVPPHSSAWMTATFTVANDELFNVEAWTIENEPTEGEFVSFSQRFISLLKVLPTPEPTSTPTNVPPTPHRDGYWNHVPIVRNGPRPTPPPEPTLVNPPTPTAAGR